MMKKIDELKHVPKDPNTPESQEFLRNLQQRIKKGTDELRKIVDEWKKEDQQHEDERK